jgi:hypothetical protein
MKKVSLILLMAAIGVNTQIAHAQQSDTSKNKIEVKKKVKTGVNGRHVTKIKVEGKGTPESINNAAAAAATGKTQVVVTPAPTVVVAPAAKPTTTVTTTTQTQTKPVVTTNKKSVVTTKTHVSHRAAATRRP